MLLGLELGRQSCQLCPIGPYRMNREQHDTGTHESSLSGYGKDRVLRYRSDGGRLDTTSCERQRKNDESLTIG